MWKNLFKQFNCELKVINETDNENDNECKEIFNDIISLLNCFAMKMYSSRRKKKINLIKEDLKNDINLQVQLLRKGYTEYTRIVQNIEKPV